MEDLVMVAHAFKRYGCHKRYAKKLDLDLDIISKVIKVSNKIRSSYSNLMREKEQKINFNLNS